ncbi:TPA: hypothetical protein PJR49_005249 [Escherichia coli]|uniref:Chromosome segregation ATPase n=1 Tax=Proteus hauseri ATCC 700826 TaxID=1354271 RepID=A0AAJ3LVK0_PROHU|nr:hypothetical protein [Proteus hauseri]OAT51110.1 chromosome segregation ATPase [Proteus hauseri ATCC 700826]HDH9217312.1 hypothetical protein [Escherichia coli]
MKKRLMAVLGLSTVLVLSGCQSNNGADPRITNNSDMEFFSKSGITACAGGAAIGALGCLVSNSSNKGACMLIAAVAGCGVGIGANAYLDNKRKDYSSKEEMLNSMIADIKKENQHLQSASNAARAVIDDDKKALAKIEQDMKQQRLNKAAAEKQLKGIDANIAALRSRLSDMTKREAEWRDIAAKSRDDGIKTAQLDKQITGMKQQVASLQEELDSLYSQRTAIRLS